MCLTLVAAPLAHHAGLQCGCISYATSSRTTSGLRYTRYTWSLGVTMRRGSGRFRSTSGLGLSIPATAGSLMSWGPPQDPSRRRQRKHPLLRPPVMFRRQIHTGSLFRMMMAGRADQLMTDRATQGLAQEAMPEVPELVICTEPSPAARAQPDSAPLSASAQAVSSAPRPATPPLTD